MRVCVLCERMTPSADEGIRNYALQLVRELRQHHTVLALTTRGHDIPSLGVRNIATNSLFLNVRLLRAVRSFQPQVIFYVPTACATLFSFLRSRVLRAYAGGAPVVLVALQVRRYGCLSRALMPHLCPEMVLVQSAETEASLSILGGRQGIGGSTPGSNHADRVHPLGCRIRQTVPGIDLDRFKPLPEVERTRLRQQCGLDPSTFLIVHVGHLKRGRNVQVLLPLHLPPGQQVAVVGSTSTDHDHGLVGELERAGVRVITRFVPDIVTIYQMADCYVFPVQASDGIDGAGEAHAIDVPLSVLEAMACNLPVVTTRYGGLSELFEEGSGLYYISNTAELALAVQEVRSAPPPNTRSMVELFAWPRVVDGLMRLVTQELGLANDGPQGCAL